MWAVEASDCPPLVPVVRHVNSFRECTAAPVCDVVGPSSCWSASRTIAICHSQRYQLHETMLGFTLLLLRMSELDETAVACICSTLTTQCECTRRCKYEGERCSHVNFTKVVTDYGLCYTFNSEQELDTSKTGKLVGLYCYTIYDYTNNKPTSSLHFDAQMDLLLLKWRKSIIHTRCL